MNKISKRLLLFFRYLLHLPDAPHGRTRPFPETGRPTSSETTCPPNFGMSSVDSM